MKRIQWVSFVVVALCVSISLQAVKVLAEESFSLEDSLSKARDIGKSLFSREEDSLFSEEDKWAALVDDQRKIWTAANHLVNTSNGMEEVLKGIDVIRRKGLVVPVAVHIVAAGGVLTHDVSTRISMYAASMRAGEDGISLGFKVSFSSQTLFEHISVLDPKQHSKDLVNIFEHTATTLGAPNTLFVIINHPKASANGPVTSDVFLGHRMSWMLYNTEKGHRLTATTFLVAVERAAERVYAPKPLYFPIPSIRQLRVELASYSPGHDHRALWLEKFIWSEFESSVRSVAVPGQSVSFFSFQANSECQDCELAFRNIEKYDQDFIRKAAATLNHGIPPNQSWATGEMGGHSKKKVPRNTFRLYVLDTAKLKKSEIVRRLERRAVWVFPGMGIITLRSSDAGASRRLQSQLTSAVVAGVYGVADPELYMHTSLQSHASTAVRSPSSILQDVITRNLIRSLVYERLADLQEIADGLLYFDINPAISLGERDYARFAQRINLMLVKLTRAQHEVTEGNTVTDALRLVISTQHEVRSIRAAFGLSADVRSLERFRDPTIRCHFSRLHREALRASEILESGLSIARSALLAAMCFSASTAVTYFLVQRYSKRAMGKRE